MLAFETLTLVPIDRQLMEPALLTPQEITWVNTYHQRVHDEIAPLLADSPAAQRWLMEATRPLAVMG